MNLLISQHAIERMKRFDDIDIKFLSEAFKEMEVEKFPKIRALLRSDVPDKEGNFIRKFGDYRIVYRFADDKPEPTIIIVTIIKKDTSGVSHF